MLFAWISTYENLLEIIISTFYICYTDGDSSRKSHLQMAKNVRMMYGCDCWWNTVCTYYKWKMIEEASVVIKNMSHISNMLGWRI